MNWKNTKESPPDKSVCDAVVKKPGHVLSVASYISNCPGVKDGFYLLGNGQAIRIDGVEWYLPIPKQPNELA